MSFKVTTSTTTKLVFERPKMGYGVWWFALSLFIIGVVVNRLFPGLATPAAVITQGLCFAVAYFIFMISVFGSAGKDSLAPPHIIFDRARGAIEIASEAGMNSGHVIIPFSEIVEVGLDVQTRTDKENRDRTQYHFYVELTGGGRWYLTSFINQSEAEALVKQLETVIDRSVTSVPASKVVLPQGWRVESSAEQLLVSWTNPVGNRPWNLLFQSLVVIVHFAGITYFLAQRENSQMPIFLVMISPFAALVAWLGYRKLKRLIQDKVTRFAIRLSKEGFDYYEFEKEGGAQRNHVHLNLHDIETVRHTYSPERGLPHDIMVIRKDEDKHLLLFSVLAPIERQQAVDWLRQQIAEWRKTSGTNVKNEL